MGCGRSHERFLKRPNRTKIMCRSYELVEEVKSLTSLKTKNEVVDLALHELLNPQASGILPLSLNSFDQEDR